MIQNLTKFASVVFDSTMTLVQKILVALLIAFVSVLLVAFGFTALIANIIR